MNKFYNTTKIFSYPEKLEALKNGQIFYPVHVRIKPTNSCNHDCNYCAYRNSELILGKNTNLNDQLSNEKFMEILEDIVAMDVKAVTFSGGGEPLLHPMIEDAISFLGSAEIKVGIITNGSLIHRIKHLADIITWVRVSIDGHSPEVYSQIRNVKKDEFHQVLENIQAISSQTTVGINLVITQDNYQNIASLCFEFKKIGANHVKISACITPNPFEYHSQIKEEVFRQILKAEELQDNSFTVINHYHIDADGDFQKSYTQCTSINFLTIIGADAKVYLCQDKAYCPSSTLVDLKRMGLKEAWDSALALKMINKINPAIMCNHHCTGHNKNLQINQYLEIDEKHRAFV